MPKHFVEIERHIDRLKPLLLRTLSGLVFGVLCIVFLCLISLILLAYPFDYFLFCFFAVVYYRTLIVLFLSIKILLPIKKKRAKKFAVVNGYQESFDGTYILFVNLELNLAMVHSIKIIKKQKKKKERYGSKVLSV